MKNGLRDILACKKTKKSLETSERTSNDSTPSSGFETPSNLHPPPAVMHLEQTCQSNGAKWSNRGCFCVRRGRREEKHRCPVSERPIKQHTGPGGRKLLLTGRHQEKRTFQSTHIQHCTHTHTQHGG